MKAWRTIEQMCMKNNQEQGQRRSNPGRGQLESTRRSIKNALYTMRDVMQDDDMAENMQNSFQVIINTTLPNMY